ncbi:hypothetical protein [Billgrantia endophytica]|uniref:Tripartite tricarboxylate transporter TctB family protein n=1 Tax=Billgrantia endophytica TaxID=2033802 RepID=A0A2N7U9N2_9GAMM|nr:hypothetical protein [Halomonas endophytica]PMR77115.1 hypothetical protein C1H69_03655 [Halomonas endophytica]
MTDTPRKNFWSGLGVATVSVVLITWIIPTYGGSGFAFGLPPQLLATLGAWLMLACAAALSIVSFITLKRDGKPLIAFPEFGHFWHQTWPFLYVLAFIVLVDRFPLTWTAPFMIGALLLILGERRWHVVVLSSIIPAAGLYGLTAHLMRIGVV